LLFRINITKIKERGELCAKESGIDDTSKISSCLLTEEGQDLFKENSELIKNHGLTYPSLVMNGEAINYQFFTHNKESLKQFIAPVSRACL